MITAKIVRDSISPKGVRLTTLQLKYPRFIHSEFMTHRVFSRNASSSRAIPVAKMIEQVRSDPAMTIHWGRNQTGMQAYSELDDSEKEQAKIEWRKAAESAANHAENLMNIGAHKQIANRILEPFQWIHVVVTATEWDNFFELRDHPAAEPNIQALARAIKNEMSLSTPNLLILGEWHLPYVSDEEIKTLKSDSRFLDAIKCSAARCARVSYMKHDGGYPSIEDDIELYNQLVTRPFVDKRGNVYSEKDPIHASPIEHQATPSSNRFLKSGNFVGWIQHRQHFLLSERESNE